MEDLLAHLCPTLKLVREEHGIGLAAVATEAGLDRTDQLALYESGRRVPDRKRAARLACAYSKLTGIPEESLWEQTLKATFHGPKREKPSR